MYPCFMFLRQFKCVQLTLTTLPSLNISGSIILNAVTFKSTFLCTGARMGESSLAGSVKETHTKI